jgi:quaternary ammonium compound-resistance protein SugE
LPGGSLLWLEKVMPWTLLLVAGLLEVGWAVGLKYTAGFTRPMPSVLTIGAMIGSFVLLAEALKALPIGTAYAVWTGIGAVGTAVIGILVFGESASLPRIACIACIVAGIAGLRLVPA